MQVLGTSGWSFHLEWVFRTRVKSGYWVCVEGCLGPCTGKGCCGGGLFLSMWDIKLSLGWQDFPGQKQIAFLVYFSVFL